MNRVGEPFEPRDERRVVDPRHVRRRTAARRRDDARALKDEADAALYRRFEFVYQGVDGVLAVAGTLEYRCPIEPVWKPAAADVQRFGESGHGAPGSRVRSPRCPRIHRRWRG